MIPLRTDEQSKLPAWKAWQNKTPAEGITEIEYRARLGVLGNIGIVAGRNSGNLFQFEIDGLDLYAEVVAAIPELSDTWSVLSGGGNGIHIYGCADELPPTTIAKTGEHLEARFKSDGQQCVAPPSLHPVTKQAYTTYDSKPIRHFAQLTIGTIMAFIEAKRPLVVAPATMTRPLQPRIGAAATDEKGMVVDALRCMPAESIPYDGHGGSWISILAALTEAYGDAEAERIAETWSGWCSKPNEISDKIKSFKPGYKGQRATLGTIFFLAEQNGYERPLSILNNSKPLFDFENSDASSANLPQEGAYCHPDGDARNWMIALCKAFPGQRNMLKFARLWWGALRQSLVDPLDATYKALFAACKVLNIPITDSAIRDVTQIQVNIFIDACLRNRVQVVTPSIKYVFHHPSMGEFYKSQFRRKCEMAAEYLNFLKSRLGGARDRLRREGKYARGRVPLGYMVDRNKLSETHRQLVPLARNR